MKLPLPYYRDSAAAVLASFESQTNGLSPTQVTERKRHNERFTMPPAKSHNLLTGSLSLRVGLLLGCVVLTAYANEFSLAILLLAVMLVFGVLSGIYDRHVWHGRTSSSLRLPVYTHVVRRNTLLRIPISKVVAGDIVYLEAGDIVPADLRILKTDNLSVTEAVFSGLHNPVHKNSRSLESYVARDKQTNMLFFGSNIIAGNGYGVVTALGKHTELGRMLWADKKKPVRPISKATTLLQRRLDIGCSVLITVLTALTLANGWTLGFFATATASLLIATSLLDFYIAAPFIAAHYTHVIGRSGTKVLQLASLESIGSTATILSDLRTALLSNTLKISNLVVGSQNYDLTKKMNKQQQTALQPVADTAHLLARLPANAAFLQLTKSLPSTTTTEYEYESSSSLNPAESIHGSSWRSGEIIMRVASGELTELLNHTTHLWDHGHTRICTANDRTRLQKIATQQSRVGETLIGFAYSRDDDQFVFAGYISARSQSPHDTKKSITELKQAHIGLVLISDDSIDQTQWLLEQSGINLHNPTLLTHADITSFDGKALAALVSKAPLILQNVSQADISYVATVLQQNGPITIVGDHLEIAEVLAKADSVIAGSHTLAADYASVITKNSTLPETVHVVTKSRELLTKLAGIQVVTPMLAMSLLLLVALSIGLYAAFSVPLMISAYTTIIVLIIVLPVLISSAWDKTSQRVASTKPQFLTSQKINLHHALLQTLLLAGAGGAAFFGFLMLHNINSSGLAMNSVVYEKAFTATTLTLAICIVLQIFMSRSDSRHAHKSSAGHTLYFWVALIISIGLVYAFAYSVSLHELFGTSSPLSEDWLLINGLGICYGLITALLHYDKHHTRASVIALQGVHTQ